MCSPGLMGGTQAVTQAVGQQVAARKINEAGAEAGAGMIGQTVGAQSALMAQNFIAAQNAARKSFAFKQKKEHGLARVNVSYADQYSLHSAARVALHNSAMDAEWASAQAGGIRAMKTQDQMDVNQKKLLAGLASIPTVSRGEQALQAIGSGVSGASTAYSMHKANVATDPNAGFWVG